MRTVLSEYVLHSAVQSSGVKSYSEWRWVSVPVASRAGRQAGIVIQERVKRIRSTEVGHCPNYQSDALRTYLVLRVSRLA